MSWAGSSARDLWGRGYAGEISRTLLDYAFDVLGLRQVVGETIDLRRAGRLLGQLGMAKLGETQVTDCRGRPAALYQYAVTAEQWRERKRLLAFFDAENRRDWGLYQTFLHPEVVWELRQPDGWGEQIRGIQAYLGRIQAAYEGPGRTIPVRADRAGRRTDRRLAGQRPG